MELKAYLNQYNRLDMRIKSNEKNLTYYDKHFPLFKENQQIRDKINADNERVKADIENLRTLKSDIEIFIDNIEDDRDRLLLYKRYIERKTWKTIAIEMYYSSKHVQRIHNTIMSNNQTVH